jgi:hypothetical protein
MEKKRKLSENKILTLTPKVFVSFVLPKTYKFPSDSYPSSENVVLDNQDILFAIFFLIPEYTVQISSVCKLFYSICKKLDEFLERNHHWNWVYGLSSNNKEQITENMLMIKKNLCWTVVWNDSLIKILNSHREALIEYQQSPHEGFSDLNFLLNEIIEEFKSSCKIHYLRIWIKNLCSEVISEKIIDSPLYYKNISIFVFSEMFFARFSTEYLNDGFYNWFFLSGLSARKNSYKHSIEQKKFSFRQYGLLTIHKSSKGYNASYQATGKVLTLLLLGEFK